MSASSSASASLSSSSATTLTPRLPPDANRILFVRNLPTKVKSDDLWATFGKFGAVRQLRVGSDASTRGTAFVVYEDLFDARAAKDGLKGFNIGNRYPIVAYYKPAAAAAAAAGREKDAAAAALASAAADGDEEHKRAQLDALKAKYGVSGEE